MSKLNIFYVGWDSFWVGFIAFPVVWYLTKAFGKQVWEDLKILWSKYT